MKYYILNIYIVPFWLRGARWLSGRVSDSGARGPGFETYRRRVVSLSKTLYSPKVLVNYPGSDVPSRHDWKIVDWDVKPQHNQPFWLLLGPKEGPIPNAKKHLFSPNCWLKIPNLKILKNSTWEIQLEHNYDFLSFSSQTVLLKDNKALKPSCNVLGHDLSIFQPLKHVITFPNFLFLWANFPNSEGPCPNYWNTVYREISEIFQCEHAKIA